MRIPMRKSGERGIALVTTLLILLLLSSLIVGFILLVMTDQGINGMDRDQTVTFYAAYGAMEAMTANLGTLFQGNYAATGAQINALTATPPTYPGIIYRNQLTGGSGYEIAFPTDPNGNPVASNGTINSGPYQGFIGLITPFTMTVTAASLTGSEVRLRRSLQTVAIPVFQFGIFSQTDLSFFAGPNFNFGGRVHTNGNLWLASGSTATLSDKVTASGEVIRTNLSNGWSTSSGYTGTVNVTTAPGTTSYRALGMSEGSLVGTLGTALNEPTWTNNSIGAYNGNLRNGRTGARQLNLTLTTYGATPIELIRLPVQNENVTNPALLGERYFSQASLRILLADSPADILNLPGVTATAPVPLVGVVAGAGVSVPPFATSSGVTSQGYWTVGGTPLIGGFIKIELQNAAFNWIDVTQEILSLGTTGRNLSNGTLNTPGNTCGEPNPNAILRFQRVRDIPILFGPCAVGVGGAMSTAPTDYWPNVLFDTREGTLRDGVPSAPHASNLMLAGVMHYVELDVTNLSRWFTGAIGASGTRAISVTGYTVYFSDRRNNAVDPVLNHKNGEFGAEDFVNPASSTGAQNGILDPGEDLDGTGNLVTYGQTPPPAPSVAATVLAAQTGSAPPGGIVPSAATSVYTYVTPTEARVNAPLFFRRALKLVHGGSINLGSCAGVVCGLTVVAENPVYVQGDYNSTGGTFTGPHVASAVLADAFTLLSNNWNDIRSFTNPYSPGSRGATTSWFRLAVVAGKGISFPHPGGYSTYQDFGTDGGVHNFLRYLESWSGQTLNYRGSIVSFYYNRQAVGVFKCCATVYSPPSRGYNFDVEFLQPTLLPPRTPMFRDVNTIGFSQLIMPNQ